MRIAFISDLHANVEALDAVLRDVEQRGVDRVVCLGDVVDLGPSPQATVDRLRQDGIPIVLGNHDPLDEPTTIPLLSEIQRWTQEKLDDETRRFLAARPREIVIEAHDVRLLGVHASPRSLTDSMLTDTPEATLDAMFAGATFDVLVGGHTHVPMVRRIGGSRLMLNVGSVGMPFDAPFRGDAPRVLRFAEYGLVELGPHGTAVEHRRVTYDFDAFCRTVHASGMPDPDAWLSHWSG